MGDGQNHRQETNSAGRADILGENEESQGRAFLKLLQVPSRWAVYASSGQAHVRQVCGLELHWGPSAKPGTTEASLASLPHQLSDPQKPADLMGKITMGQPFAGDLYVCSSTAHPIS